MTGEEKWVEVFAGKTETGGGFGGEVVEESEVEVWGEGEEGEGFWGGC